MYVFVSWKILFGNHSVMFLEAFTRHRVHWGPPLKTWVRRSVPSTQRIGASKAVSGCYGTRPSRWQKMLQTSWRSTVRGLASWCVGRTTCSTCCWGQPGKHWESLVHWGKQIDDLIQVPWLKQDDGWPESVEKQSLLLLVWRHYITR